MARILVVDDQAPVRDVIAQMCEELGHVASRATGTSAVAAVREHQPDIVLLDLLMADVPGATVLQQLRTLDPGLRVIVLTGVVEPSVEDAVRELGAAGVLRKPASMTALRRALDAALSGQR